MVQFLPQVTPQYPYQGLNALLQSQQNLGSAITGYGEGANQARIYDIHRQAGARAAQGDIQGAMNVYYQNGLPEYALKMNREWEQNQLFPSTLQEARTKAGLGAAQFEEWKKLQQQSGGAPPTAAIGRSGLTLPGAGVAAGVTENTTPAPASSAQPPIQATRPGVGSDWAASGGTAYSPYQHDINDRTIGHIQNYVLNEPDPTTAAVNWREILGEYPGIANHLQSVGYNIGAYQPGDAKAAAQRVVADMRAAAGPAPSQAGAVPQPQPAPMIAGAPRPQLASGVPGLTAPPVAGGAPGPAAGPLGPAPQPGMTREQQIAEQYIAGQKAYLLRQQLAGMNIGDARAKLDEQVNKGTVYVPGIGEVPLYRHLENQSAAEAAKTAATEGEKYYDNLYKGMRGKANIAAWQKQNIDIGNKVLNDPNFVSGSADQKQLMLQRALATMGYNVNASQANEVFKQTMTRILADQIAAIKSDSTLTGETAPRIFRSMLDIEEKALPNENDSLEGLRRKLDIFGRAGDLAIKFADMADRYASGNNGRLDSRFDMAMRHEVANSRLYAPGEFEARSKKEEAAVGLTHDQIVKMRDGEDTPDGRFTKQTINGEEYLIPKTAAPAPAPKAPTRPLTPEEQRQAAWQKRNQQYMDAAAAAAKRAILPPAQPLPTAGMPGLE